MVVVERERSVAGDVLCKNGHMDFDWRKRASMLVKCAACMGFGVRGKGASKSSVVEGEDGRERGKVGSKMCQRCTT